MAQATNNYTQFHNLSNEALADAIGNADLALKAYEAEVKALKDEFKNRGLLTTAGEHFTVTRSDQFSSRLDVSRRESNIWARRGVVSKRRASRPSFASKPPSGSRARRKHSRPRPLAARGFGCREHLPGFPNRGSHHVQTTTEICA